MTKPTCDGCDLLDENPEQADVRLCHVRHITGSEAIVHYCRECRLILNGEDEPENTIISVIDSTPYELQPRK